MDGMGNKKFALESCLGYKCDTLIVEVADTARRLTLQFRFTLFYVTLTSYMQIKFTLLQNEFQCLLL